MVRFAGAHTRRGLHRAVAIAIAVMLFAALMVLASPPGTARAAGGTTTKTTSFSTDCVGVAIGQRQPESNPLTQQVTAPDEVGRGQQFTVRVTPQPATMPYQKDSLVGMVRVFSLQNIKLMYELPAGTEFAGASMVPGSGFGTEGEPTVTLDESFTPARVVLGVPKMPGNPQGPNMETSFQLPAFDLTLNATGDVGDDIEVRIAGSNEATSGYTFGAQSIVVAQVKCWPTPANPGVPALPNRAPVMSTTRIVHSTAPSVSTQTALTASPSSVPAGNPVQLSATVTSPAGTTPVGNVEFRDTTTSTVLGTATLNEGVATLSANLNGAPGPRAVTARYTGIPGLNASTSAPATITVTDPAGRSRTSLAVTANPASVAPGAATAVSVTATPVAAAPGAPKPTGLVTILDNGEPAGSALLADGTASVSVALGGTAGHVLTARYEGDTLHQAATGATGATSKPAANVSSPAVTGTLRLDGQDIALGATTYTGRFGTTDTGEQSLDGVFAFAPSTVSVTGPSGTVTGQLSQVGPATGKITVGGAATLTSRLHLQVKTVDLGAGLVDLASNCQVGPFDVALSGTRGAGGAVSMSASGFSVPTVPAGSCYDAAGADVTSQVQALFVGSDNNLSVGFTLNAAPLATMSNVSTSPASPTVLGEPVTLTATLERVGGGSIPAGTVEFWDGDVKLPTQTVVPVPSGGGVVTTRYTPGFTGVGPLRVGTHQITARYVPTNPTLISSATSPEPATHVVNPATPAATTIAVTSTPSGSAPVGQEVRYDVQVSPVPTRTFAANKVTLQVGINVLGRTSVTLDNEGKATIYGAPPAGTTHITASFVPGDVWAFQPSTALIPFTVTGTAVPTQVTATLPEGPVANAGSSLAVAVQVTPGIAGVVTLFIDGTQYGLAGSPVDPVTGKLTMQVAVGVDADPARTITGVFNPTSPVFAASRMAPIDFQVIRAVDVTPTIELTITPAADPVFPGTVLKARIVTIAPGPAPQVAGKIRLMEGATTPMSLRIPGPNGVTEFDVTPAVGTRNYRVEFVPDADRGFLPATSAVVTKVVAAAQDMATTTVLEAAPAGTGYFDTPVLLRATVTPADPNVVAPVGKVEFFAGATLLGQVNMAGTLRVISFTPPYTGVNNKWTMGDHQLRAVFTPTNPASFRPSTSPDVPYSIVVPVDRPTTTTITSAPTVVLPPNSSRPLSLVAEVTAGAEGNVEFRTGETLLGTASVRPQIGAPSTASLNITSAIPLGELSVTATFVPTVPAEFQGSTSVPVTINSLFVPAPTSVAVAASPGSPSLPAAPVTLTATVPANIAGTVQFNQDGVLLGAVEVVSGTASFVVEDLAAGEYDFQVGFLPTLAAYTASTGAVTHRVVPPAVETTTALSVSPAGSSGEGTEVTLSATVTPAGAVGSVELLDGATVIGTRPVADGTASFATSSLTEGTHTLSARFVPTDQGAFLPSTSPTVDHVVSATADPTETALVVSPASPTVSGTEVTLSATVTPAGAAGSVELLDGETVIGTQPVAGGAASFATSSLSVGTHQLSARFVPTNPEAFLGSVSPTVEHVVSALPATATSTGLVVAPAGSSGVGVEVLLDAAVAPAAAVGSVEFLDGATVIGTEPLVAGAASFVTSSLALGTHELSARFVPSDPEVFLGSVSSTVDHVVSDLEPTVPGAPTGVVAVGGHLQASVSWSAPASDGGSPIVGYDVRGLGGAVLTSTSADVTSVAVIGLAAQDDMTFTVLARNAVGSSGSSEASNAVDVSAAEKVFSDVPAGHVFYDEVNWAIVEGITVGFPDGDFRPGNPVSRQAMAAFLYRFAGEPAFTAPEDPSFGDVPLTNPFFKEIEWLSATGITTGAADGLFRPGEVVSRQAMAAFLYRFAGEPAFTAPGVPSFGDVPLTNPFYLEVEWLASTGITTGFPGEVFKPAAAVSRQSMVAFMYRYTTQLVPVAPPIGVG